MDGSGQRGRAIHSRGHATQPPRATLLHLSLVARSGGPARRPRRIPSHSPASRLESIDFEDVSASASSRRSRFLSDRAARCRRCHGAAALATYGGSSGPRPAPTSNSGSCVSLDRRLGVRFDRGWGVRACQGACPPGRLSPHSEQIEAPCFLLILILILILIDRLTPTLPRRETRRTHRRP